MQLHFRSTRVALVATFFATAAAAQSPRQVAAPPADVHGGVVRLPAPESTATRSAASVHPLRFERRRDGAWVAEHELALDADGALAVALLSIDAGAWTLDARDTDGAWRPFTDVVRATRAVQDPGSELPGHAVARYDAPFASAGRLAVRVTAPAGRVPEPGWLCARTSGAPRLAAWVSTPVLVADEPIAIHARFDAAGPRATVGRARVVLDTPRGALELALADDGAHADGAENDGLFGAPLPRGLSGELRARVEFEGELATGAPFARTVQLAFPVLERRAVLDGSVDARIEDELRIELALGAFLLDGMDSARRLHVSAEVWGTDTRGEWAPLCWLSRQVAPRARGDRAELALALDRRWIELAGASAPFELRAVRVQDPDTEVVFDRLDALPLALPALAPRAGAPAVTIAPDMLTGPSTLLAPGPANAGPHTPGTYAPTAPALMLVHGYCSSGSIWPAADFTAPKLEFLDPNQNRSHDQFAQLLVQRGAQANLGSFGVVAHSQGGCAALHLLTYYHSPLDASTGPRRIQSVATPYQGTPLASLGSFACGVNSDMTPSGSATWLAGIPTWARDQVWYWTTSNSGSACNFLTSLFLSDPEDGTVEQVRGQLPGAHSMGHVTGWCHTTGMSNPANYTDHARNQAMNAAAAR
ncbi:MAG: hypothetical protein IPJ77_17360 [Planctomycetes bacterium]|nr:hypothetical protein [Planctomycetota bacterium]